MLTKIKNLFSKEDKILKENKADKEEKENQIMKTDTNTAVDEKISDVFKADNETQSSITNGAQTEQVTQQETTSAHSTEEIKAEVIKVLKTCYDPEIPVDVWELGLIYEINVATNGDVLIVMTLTSPSCPVAGILPGEIEQKVKDHPMVNDCKVQLTFDPPWSQKNMSEVAKLELGFL